MPGILQDLKVVEFGGIGPAPFCCMLLADLGAEIIRIDRVATVGRDPLEPRFNPLLRNRRNVALDLKHPQGRDAALRLCDRADVLVEAFRPGVMEGLGLGPDVIAARNPALVYGRMTGWGQDGPLARAPGHDLNYIALTGALHAIGPAAAPVPPLALVGDMGGGLYLALGVLAAHLESRRSGIGQVVDAAVIDGAASMMTAFHGLLAAGSFVEQRESNRLDGGSHFYNVYETRDGQFVSLASNEPKFYARLLQKLGLTEADCPQNDRANWPRYRQRIADRIREKTRDEWTAELETAELGFAPVLKMAEAPRHPHNAARDAYVDVAGVTQPAPAPRFSRYPNRVPQPAAYAGEHTRGGLGDWGFAPSEIEVLLQSGAARQR